MSFLNSDDEGVGSSPDFTELLRRLRGPAPDPLTALQADIARRARLPRYGGLFGGDYARYMADRSSPGSWPEVAGSPSGPVAPPSAQTPDGLRQADDSVTLSNVALHPSGAAWGAPRGSILAGLDPRDAFDRVEASPPADIIANPTSRSAPSRPRINPSLGKVTVRGESGNLGPGAVSSGKGDPGGVSYGIYQFATNRNVPGQFLKEEGGPWAERFKGLTPGTPDFDQTWRSVAQEDPVRFERAQQDFAVRTYFDPQAKRIEKISGVDISNRSFALQEAVFSTSVQMGQNTSSIAHAIRDVVAQHGADATDQDFIDAIYAERGRTRPDGKLAHFPSADAKQQAGIRRRLRDERRRVLEFHD